MENVLLSAGNFLILLGVAFIAFSLFDYLIRGRK